MLIMTARGGRCVFQHTPHLLHDVAWWQLCLARQQPRQQLTLQRQQHGSVSPPRVAPQANPMRVFRSNQAAATGADRYTRGQPLTTRTCSWNWGNLIERQGRPHSARLAPTAGMNMWANSGLTQPCSADTDRQGFEVAVKSLVRQSDAARARCRVSYHRGQSTWWRGPLHAAAAAAPMSSSPRWSAKGKLYL